MSQVAGSQCSSAFGRAMAPAETTCCCSLRTGAITVASIFIIASSLLGIFLLVYLVRMPQVATYSHWDFFSTTEYTTAVCIILIIFCVLYIPLGGLLIAATKQGDRTKAKIWLFGTATLFGLRLVLLILMLANPGRASYLLLILFELGTLIFHVYAGWVVVRLMQELKDDASESVDEHIRIGPA